MMKILCALDSFKGSMSSMEAGMAARRGILRAVPDAEVFVRPLADGGEGTVDALTEGMKGKYETIRVTGPLGDKIMARYGILPGGTAVMEMASCAGLTLVPPDKRNPLYTTTAGLGEMILDAVGKGAVRFIIGIGGSATNDGGTGMLQALGYQFLDRNDHPVPCGAAGLSSIRKISTGHLSFKLERCQFHIACDVNNPLYGPEGASYIYGPQKGADAEQTAQMDIWMQEYAEIVRQYYPEADPLSPGTGAAGGLGYAFKTFLKAELCPGIQIVLQETHMEEYIRKCDLVITGEGQVDQQTAMGKAPAGIAEIAKKHGKPVLALAGSVKETSGCNHKGIDAVFSILNHPCTLEEAMQPDNAGKNMELTAEQVIRLWKSSRME